MGDVDAAELPAVGKPIGCKCGRSRWLLTVADGGANEDELVLVVAAPRQSTPRDDEGVWARSSVGVGASLRIAERRSR